MKTNKVLKWLYGVFMFLPLLAIGVTCAYVTFNKNAKDSYSGLNQNTETINVVRTAVDFDTTKTYHLQNANYNSTPSGDKNTGRIYYDLLENNSSYSALDTATNVVLYQYNNNNSCYYVFYDSNNTQVASLNSSNLFNLKINIISIGNTTNATSIFAINNSIYYIDYYNEQQLDNAFYYAVEQFNESGFNKIDFVSFFDMFYNNTNIWTTFANTYMNYVLFVSLAFFVPRVLFWFINLAFSMTDSFERKSQGW